MIETELPKYGISVVVSSFDSVRRLPKGIRHITYFFSLIKKVRGCQLILAQDTVSVGFPALLLSKIFRKRLFVRVPGDYAWEQSVQRFGVTDGIDEFQGKKYGYRVEFLRYIQKSVAKNADVIISPSEYLKRIVESWGVGMDKVRVIYNSFNRQKEIGESREELRKDLGLSGMTVITAARLVPWKGIGGLIDVILSLDNVTLLIAGDGPLKDELCRSIGDKGVSQRIKMLGELNKDTLHRYIRASDLFVLNTAYEGLSHLLLEVMSIGTPVVTTRVGGNPELIVDEENGVLVEYGNQAELRRAIGDMLDNQDIGVRYSKEAKKRVESFSKEKMLKALVSEFKQS